MTVLILLLFYKPLGSNSPSPADGEEVSKYLTHQLSPQFYNGIQYGEPFDLTVSQDGINDIIIHWQWPRKYSQITISPPKVFFTPNKISIMGTIDIKGAKFVVTVMLAPALDKNGLLNLFVKKVKVGAVNVTFIAKLIAQKIYTERLALKNIDPQDLRAKIFISLLENRPFEPVFCVRDKKARLEKFTLTDKKLTLHMTPPAD